MHVHFEQNTYTRTDSNFHSLSWMGKVPDSLPDEGGGWKLNRSQYYIEGWLASGNGKGVVGVTFTTSHCRRYEAPPRSNFNLRGHRSEVILVRWNEPYQRLATCDSRGVIFVWIKHEGRWSIELINDRNSQVTDFSWSHDGRMALICYRDGFVLVGSVAGQRYWSSMLNLDNTSITCGIWSPDDQQVMFGTTDGQVIVMSSTGAMVSQVTVHDGFEIASMAWSCERFNMDEVESKDNGNQHKGEDKVSSHVLAICFKYGDIFLMSSYDDVCPRVVYTTLTGLKMDWSNCGQYLAVGGFMRLPNLQCRNELHFYTREGKRTHSVVVPSQGKPLTAITWGHNDKRMFVAVGCQLYVAWVSKQVAPLYFLCERVVHRCVRHEKNVDHLPLPQRLRQGVQSLFSPTVKSYIPDPFKLRGFISTPPPGNERLFCTMIRHGDETSGGHYTLYLEYLGGLVPLLKGKRASKLRPDFVIFDPKIRTSGRGQSDPNSVQTDSSSESEADVVTDGCGSPRMQRRRRQKMFRAEKVDRSITFRTLDELLYNDNLPESNKLVEVTSNIWGTKFQITGVASYLPSMLGQVVYKTSLLHLQPRQMTITLQEISGSTQPLARDPNFTPAGMSDDEEDLSWFSDSEIIDTSQDVVTMGFQLDAMSEIAPSQICVDIQAPGMVTPTPVHHHLHHNHLNNNNSSESANILHNVADDSSISSNGSYLNGGGVSSLLSSKLNHTGSIYSNSLSSVQDNRTQSSSVAFSEESALTASKDIYLGQGARPKRPSSVKASEPSPTATYANGNLYPFPASATSVPLPDLPDTPVTYSPISPEPDATGILKRMASVSGDGPRWADPASQAIKYMDEDVSDVSELPFENNLVADCSPSAPASVILQRRLYLAEKTTKDVEKGEDVVASHLYGVQPQGEDDHAQSAAAELVLPRGLLASSEIDGPIPEGNSKPEREDCDFLQVSLGKNDIVSHAQSVLSNGLNGSDIEILQSASLPSSPIYGTSKSEASMRKIREELLKGKCRHLSPVFRNKGRPQECALDGFEDDLVLSVIEDFKGGQAYHSLESFQKAQLKHKIRRVQGNCSRQFVMHNKAPLWNENSQVYQLDFGGRVTQESAKNFQIELHGKQVMQFGRIDSNAYTLDFQYPFTALQAFAVALANVTQRLK